MKDLTDSVINWDETPKLRALFDHMSAYLDAPDVGVDDGEDGLIATALLALSRRYGDDRAMQIVADQVAYQFGRNCPPPSQWMPTE